MNNKQRKIGFLERIPLIFQETANGSTQVGALIKIDHSISYPLFLQAWEVLFARKPLLRARVKAEKNNHLFMFDVNFSDIEIKHILSNELSDMQSEYSQSITRLLDSQRSLWRTTLITAPKSNTSYIAFGGTHSICDGKSLSWLLGDLLRIIQQLQNNQIPHIKSDPIPEPLDTILDTKLFSPPSEPEEAPDCTLKFEQSVTGKQVISRDILRIIEPEQFTMLLASCRQHQVTITAALLTAMAQAFKEHYATEKSPCPFSIALNLRPYTKTKVADSILAFYAHQIMFEIDLSNNDFWKTCHKTLVTYNQEIKKYALGASDDESIFEGLTTATLDKIEKEEFLVPPTLSNVGVIDEAFSNCGDYQVSEFYFTVQNQLLFNIILFAATLNNSLCLDFNYCEPVLSQKTVNFIADRTIEIILEKIKQTE